MNRTFTLLLSLLFLAGTVQAQTRSFKRGVGYNKLSTEEVEALSPGLSWGYNWGHSGSGNDAAFAQYGVEYVPMAWNGINKTAIRAYLTNHPEVKYILGFNEPNFKDQSNMSPTTAANRWKDVEEIADEFGLITVGPALNYSPNPPYQDPIKWYDEFFAACADCRVDHIALHFYMPAASAIKSNVEKFKKYNRPIWLTEFCAWDDNTTASSQKKMMVETLDYLETDPDIFRYAWFKDKGWSGGHPYMQLVEEAGNGTLKALGEVFVNMSSYDDSYYHATGQRIQAEHYIRMKGINLSKTTDTDGNINISEFDQIDWAEYNVDVPAAGEYTVTFRIAAEYPDDSEVKLTVNDQIVASMIFEKKGVGVWDTQSCTANLQAGKQKIRIGFKKGGLALNWWSLAQTTGIDSPVAGRLSVYPTLTRDLLHIEGISSETVKVMDLTGKSLISQVSNGIIDVSNLTAGVYILQVKGATGKFIKQ
ncbi:MAG: carbohydrate-binding protein [Candidatus Symbiothrix sp.]|jgi:hypothetical protein|nr:carbohydrate-binding protein [Candidatus Symbiothrix sp.]